MNFTDILEQDLKNLLNETRKKYPKIRDDLQKALNELSVYKQGNSERGNTQTSRLADMPMNDIFLAIQKVPETKQQKIIEIAMSILQKMGNLQILNKENQQKKLEFLFSVQTLNIHDDNFNLKLVQSVLMLVNPKFIDFKILDHVEKILTICMSLMVSKNVLIHNSCIVGAQQLMHIAFKTFSTIIQKQILHSIQYSQEDEVNMKSSSNNNNNNGNTNLQFDSIANLKSLKNKQKLKKNNKQNHESEDHEEEEEKAASMNNSEISESLTAQSPKQFDRIFKNAQVIVEDLLSYYITQNPPSWIPQELLKDPVQSKNYEIFCLDLLILILKESGDNLEVLPQLFKQLQTQLEQKISKEMDEVFSQERVDFERTVRIFRMLNRMQTNLKCGFKFYKKIFAYIQTSQKLSLYTFIISETICEFLGDCDVIAYVVESENIQMRESLAQSNEDITQPTSALSNDSIFQAFKCITFVAKMISTLNSSDLQPQKSSNIKQNLISENWTEFPKEPTISYNQIFKSLFDCLHAYQESVLIIIQSLCDVEIGQRVVKEELKDKKEFQFIQSFIMNYWNDNLKITKYLFQFDISESINQRILNISQNWISICGTLQIHKPRDAYLKILSEYSIETPTSFTMKNNQTTKTILNITHCLQNILDATNEEDQYQSIQTDSDVQILSSLLDQTFTRSPDYEDNMLLQVLDALNTVTLSNLENRILEEGNGSENKHNQSGLGSFGNEKFALNKMLEVVSLNVFRMPILWDLVAAHFLCIANSKHDSLRIFSIEVLNDIINNTFVYMLGVFQALDIGKLAEQESPKFSSEKNKKGENKKQNNNNSQIPVELEKTIRDPNSGWSVNKWQETVFFPYLEIIKSNFADTKEALLHNLLRVLQNNGHKINSNGFKIILRVLSSIAEVSYGKTITSFAFHCLEIIINQHIHCIDNVKQIGKLLDLIENFKTISQDQNITYLSVNMFWNVSDHLTKIHQKFISKHELLLQQQQKQQQQKRDGAEDSNGEQQELLTEEDYEAKIVEFEIIWQSVFQKLQMLCVERTQGEVRQSSLQTYTGILITNTNKQFSKSFWIKTLKTSYLKLIDSFVDIIEQESQTSFQQKARQLETPKFAMNETPKFSEPKKRGFEFGNKQPPKTLPQVPVFIDIQDWIHCLQQVISNLVKIIKKAVVQIQQKQTVFPKGKLTEIQLQQQQQQVHTTTENLDIDLSLEILKKIMKVHKIDNFELKFENMKLLKEIMVYSDILVQQPTLTKDLLNMLTYEVEVVPKDGKNSKLMVQKVIPQILQNFEVYFQKEMNPEIQETVVHISEYFVNYMKQVLNFIRQIDFLNVMAPFKVWDEKPAFKFIANICGNLQHAPPSVLNTFYIFTNEILDMTQINSILNDMIFRSFLEALTNLIQFASAKKSKMLNTYVNSFYSQFQKLLNLRYDINYMRLNDSIPKKLKLQPIWVFANQCFIKVCTIQIHSEEKDMQFFNILSTILARPSDILENIPENYKGLIIQKVSEVEFQCIEFLIGQIMSESNFDEVIIDQIVFVMQNYTETLQQAKNNDTSDQENHYEIQQKYLQNLFIICDLKNGSYEQLVKISKTLVPLLIFRCRDILFQFVSDQNQNKQNLPLPKQRLQEVCFILEQLKSLDLPPGCFQQGSISSKSPRIQQMMKSTSFSRIPPDQLSNHSQSPRSQNSNDLTVNNNNPRKQSDVNSNGSNMGKHQEQQQHLNVNNTLQMCSAEQGSKNLINIDSDNPFLKGKKGHLMFLFPLFTQMLLTKEEEIRILLQQIFMEISVEMSLSTNF